jgi:hypothetical protein
LCPKEDQERGAIALSALSSLGASHAAEVRDPAARRRQIAQSSEELVPPLKFEIALTDDYSVREAVLLTFCDPLPDQRLRLAGLSEKQWRKLLTWLDISGLALYFLDRIMELELPDLLPPRVLARLQQNQRDNNVRTRGMTAESVAIQREFQKAALSYATLKGLSLFPSSVPRPELRHQFDLDFLIAEHSVSEARQILERRGYRLYAISGKSWEFKINETPGVSIEDLYKDLAGRSVELHVEPNRAGRASLLGRVERRDFCGISIPVLSAVDLFLGQGMHAYKHLNGEFSRAAHLVEFRRHVLHRRNDDAFWRDLQSRIEDDPRACLGLGVVTLLITRLMGDFAPEAFTKFTVHRLPPSARLWVELYGRGAVLQSFPGSKLYLLLQRELESAGVPAKRSLRESLFPSRLPPALIQASGSESAAVRIRRYSLQLHHIFSRVRFHFVEGLRYIWESYRWRQHMNRLTQ